LLTEFTTLIGRKARVRKKEKVRFSLKKEKVRFSLSF